jgi:hypothetical protein
VIEMISKNGQPIEVLAMLLCATTAAAQDNRGTAERAACAPNAFRLCSSYIPDPSGVWHCLRQNKSDLNDACRLVFEQEASPVASRSKY